MSVIPTLVNVKKFLAYRLTKLYHSKKQAVWCFRILLSYCLISNWTTINVCTIAAEFYSILIF